MWEVTIRGECRSIGALPNHLKTPKCFRTDKEECFKQLDSQAPLTEFYQIAEVCMVVNGYFYDIYLCEATHITSSSPDQKSSSGYVNGTVYARDSYLIRLASFGPV